jgi:hypothetical protein
MIVATITGSIAMTTMVKECEEEYKRSVSALRVEYVLEESEKDSVSIAVKKA